eukprot:945134-Prymnesium_polylepis.1
MMHTCAHQLARGCVPACPDGAPRLPACRQYNQISAKFPRRNGDAHPSRVRAATCDRRPLRNLYAHMVIAYPTHHDSITKELSNDKTYYGHTRIKHDPRSTDEARGDSGFSRAVGHFRTFAASQKVVTFAAFAALGATVSPSAFATAFADFRVSRAMRPHVSGHIFAPLAHQKLRLGHLGTKAVLSR